MNRATTTTPPISVMSRHSRPGIAQLRPPPSGRHEWRPYSSYMCGGRINPARIVSFFSEKPEYVAAAVADVIVCLLVRPFDPQESHACGIHQGPPGPEPVETADGAFERVPFYLVCSGFMSSLLQVVHIRRFFLLRAQFTIASLANGACFEVMPRGILFSTFAAPHLCLLL
jgi:hypothetical protein